MGSSRRSALRRGEALNLKGRTGAAGWRRVDAGKANGDKAVQAARLLPFPNTLAGQYYGKTP